MDADEVRRLAAGGETLAVEFKRAKGTSDRDLCEAVVCMANGPGGLILLGVEDDGTITGVPDRDGHRPDADRYTALVMNHTDPPVVAPAEVVLVDGRRVLVLDIPKSSTPVGTKDGVYRRRSLRMDGKPECVAYRPTELATAALVAMGRDYASLVMPGARQSDLDSAEFDRFRAFAATGKGDAALANAADVEILRALRLLGDAEGITVGALLLFGKPASLARFVPTAEVLFQRSIGQEVVENDSLRLPLFRTAEEVYQRLQTGNIEYELMIGMHRATVRRIPDRIAREAVANALTHRDFSENAPILVQVDDDSLTVTSPGGLPSGVTLANLMVQSRPRSPILADAFKRAGLVDRVGRGVPDMYLATLTSGRGEPDYSLTTDHSVTVAVPISAPDRELVRFILSYQNEHPSSLGLDQLRTLHAVKADGPSSLPELSSRLRMTSAATRTAVNRLVELGLLEERGTGRGRRVQLSAAFYRIADDRGAYIRISKPESAQHRQMIQDYARQFGRITRAEAADLCLVSPDAARRMLAALVSDGALEMRGTKRGAYYVLAESDARPESS